MLVDELLRKGTNTNEKNIKIRMGTLKSSFSLMFLKFKGVGVFLRDQNKPYEVIPKYGKKMAR